LAGIVHREDELHDDHKKGVLDEPGYRRQLERLRAERDDYTRKLEAAHEDLDDEYLFPSKRTLELAIRAKALWISANAQERRVFLEAVLSNARLSGVSVSYDLKKPFKLLSEMRGNSKWRARRDSNPRP